MSARFPGKGSVCVSENILSSTSRTGSVYMSMGSSRLLACGYVCSTLFHSRRAASSLGVFSTGSLISPSRGTSAGSSSERAVPGQKNRSAARRTAAAEKPFKISFSMERPLWFFFTDRRPGCFLRAIESMGKKIFAYTMPAGAMTPPSRLLYRPPPPSPRPPPPPPLHPPLLLLYHPPKPLELLGVGLGEHVHEARRRRASRYLHYPPEHRVGNPLCDLVP